MMSIRSAPVSANGGSTKRPNSVEVAIPRKAAKKGVTPYVVDSELATDGRRVASPFRVHPVATLASEPSPTLQGSEAVVTNVERRLPASEPSPTLQDLEAVVINLERRPDRLQDCAVRLQTCCPWLRHAKFSACDGRQETMSEAEVVKTWNTERNVVFQKRRAIRKGWDDLDSYKVLNLCLSPGERGCAISHVRAWRHCIERACGTERPLLVLEDDAAPTPEFTSSLERAMASTPADAHVLYLGYSQATEWRREVSKDVVESEYVWTTVAYILWPAGARALLDLLPVDQPVDNFMAYACARGAIKAYCVRPKIVLQNDAWNTNSDVAHSDEHYWGADSDIPHSDSFLTAAAPEQEMAGGSKLLAAETSFWDMDSDDSDDAPGDM